MKKIILAIVIFSSFFANSQCWKSVETGLYHTAGIKSDGTLWKWGCPKFHWTDFSNGILTPQQIGTDTDWQKLSLTYATVLALKNNGTLWGYGVNNFGTVGNGELSEVIDIIQIGSDNDWQSVSAGVFHSAAIKSNGTLWAWGDNWYYNLGDGTNTPHLTPTQIGTDTDWVFVSVGSATTYAIKSNGTLWSWGVNIFGQLGQGTFQQNIPVPTQVGTDTDWQFVSISEAVVAALKSDGTLWTCGRNESGQLGSGASDPPYQSTLQEMQPGTTWESVDLGTFHLMAIKPNGTLWTWGYNAHWQIGNNSDADVFTPLQISDSSDWQYVSGGDWSSAALKSDGSLYTWGDNVFGQLGINSTENASVPTAVACPESLGIGSHDAVGFSIYPNPASSILHIQNQSQLPIDHVTIYDISGKKILDRTGTISELCVDEFASGMYLVHAFSDGNMYSGKFVKL